MYSTQHSGVKTWYIAIVLVNLRYLNWYFLEELYLQLTLFILFLWLNLHFIYLNYDLFNLDFLNFKVCLLYFRLVLEVVFLINIKGCVYYLMGLSITGELSEIPSCNPTIIGQVLVFPSQVLTQFFLVHNSFL